MIRRSAGNFGLAEGDIQAHNGGFERDSAKPLFPVADREEASPSKEDSDSDMLYYPET